MTTDDPPRIQRVHAGYKIERDDLDLTLRQREVMGHLARGATSGPVIAEAMGLTRQRVNSLVREIKRKGWVPVRGGWFRVTEGLEIEVLPNGEDEKK